MVLANAFLGNEKVFHTFKFNPSAVNWSYGENSASFDTLGGRVVQLLSAKVNAMTVIGVSGSRQELQRIAKNLQKIFQYQIATQQPVMFKVPSLKWEFQVYLQSVGQLGWDVQTVSYPYQLQLSVIDDLTGIKTKEINQLVFDRLADGIGYNPDVHGGDAPKFEELVNSLQLAYNTASGNTGGVDEGEETTTTGSGSTSGTDAIKKVYKYVWDKYPNKVTNMGIFVCKKIKDSESWSQHSWGNALDIGGDSNTLNAVASDLLSQARAGSLPIAQILWQYKNLLSGGSVYNHTNHIHISGDPMFSGVPPCGA